jgi:alkylhydroperoxidase family enzyme
VRIGVSWLTAQGPGGASLDGIFGLRPELPDGYLAFLSLFWERNLVDPVLLELCRLRIAQIHDCRSELLVRYRPAVDAGLSERDVAALAEPGRHTHLSSIREACVRLAEKFTLDVHSISDDDVVEIRTALGEAATVALVEVLALFDGFMRFRVLLGVLPLWENVTVVDAPNAARDGVGARA